MGGRAPITEVTLDADAPVSTLISNETYRPNRDAVLLVRVEDATTYATLLEMGVSADGGQTYTWEAAPPCQDAQSEGAAWCPPSARPAKAVTCCNSAPPITWLTAKPPTQTYTVLVDDTPPQASTSIAPGQILRPQRDPSVESAWVVALSGAVSNPPL